MMHHSRMAWGLVLAMSSSMALGGCESTARQDPLFVRNSSDTLVFQGMGLFRDRPLNESVRSVLELADYSTALAATGLLTDLQRPGPYTVFAIPNEPLEAAQAAQSGHLLDSGNLPALRRQMAYTIVPGRYSERLLRRMIGKQHGAVGLRTIDGDVLTVSVEAATNQLLLSDPQGRTNRIWLADMPQSNGLLYATQSMLSPSATVVR